MVKRRLKADEMTRSLMEFFGSGTEKQHASIGDEDERMEVSAHSDTTVPLKGILRSQSVVVQVLNERKHLEFQAGQAATDLLIIC